MSETIYEKLEEGREPLDGEEFGTPLLSEKTETTRAWRFWSLWCLHALLLASNIVFAMFLSRTQLHSFMDFDEWEYAPLRSEISYERDYFEIVLGRSPAFPENSVLEVNNKGAKTGTIKAQKEELDRLNLSSVPFADGSGYMVTLDAFHQLHCLDRLRRAVINNTADSSDWAIHIDHCLETLQRSIQCHADTTLLTYKWIKDYPKPWPDFRSYHTCRNWEAIREFAESQWFDAFVPGTLVHPEMGPWPPYPNQHYQHQGSGGLPIWPIQYLDNE